MSAPRSSASSLVRRPAALVAAGLLLSSALAGCAGTTEKYCSSLGDQQEALRELAGSAGARQGDVLDESIDLFAELEAQAPEDVAGQWDTVGFALRSLDEALDEADVPMDEFRPGERPEGVSKDEQQAVEAAAEDLRSDEVVAAGEGIEQHAREVCGVDLSL